MKHDPFGKQTREFAWIHETSQDIKDISKDCIPFPGNLNPFAVREVIGFGNPDFSRCHNLWLILVRKRDRQIIVQCCMGILIFMMMDVLILSYRAKSTMMMNCFLKQPVLSYIIALDMSENTQRPGPQVKLQSSSSSMTRTFIIIGHVWHTHRVRREPCQQGGNILIMSVAQEIKSEHISRCCFPTIHTHHDSLYAKRASCCCWRCETNSNKHDKFGFDRLIAIELWWAPSTREILSPNDDDHWQSCPWRIA